MSVSLTYHRNGATGGSVPVDATAYTAGASVTVQGNGGALNLAGYTFAGWNTAADGTGTTYAPGAVFAISADTTLYAIWSSASSLITPTGLRAHVSTGMTDVALQEIIDAEEQEIVSRFGAHASQVETFEEEIPGDYLFPKRPVLSVTSIVETVIYRDNFIGDWCEETPVTLAASDYEIVAGGKQIRRLGTGAHPREDWGQRVVMIYVPIADTAKRVKALYDLCSLAVSSKPGLKSESIGGGEYSYTAADLEAEREKILARLGTNQRSFA